MDEPLSNLDAELRVHMRAEIAQLHRQLGATFIYVTHDQVEAMTMSDRVAVILGGELQQFASPEALSTTRPPRVAEFVGTPQINVLPGPVRTAAASTFPAAARRPVAALPWHQPCSRRSARSCASPRLSGRWHSAGRRHRENLGSDLFLHVGRQRRPSRRQCARSSTRDTTDARRARLAARPKRPAVRRAGRWIVTPRLRLSAEGTRAGLAMSAPRQSPPVC